MAWLDEATVAGIIPRGLPPFGAWNWTWTWDGFEHVDPLKEADADAAMVANNMASLSEVCSKRGRDWRVVLRQRAAEKAMEREMGVEPQQPAARQPQPQEQPA
jgi:capsid protein